MLSGLQPGLLVYAGRAVLLPTPHSEDDGGGLAVVDSVLSEHQ